MRNIRAAVIIVMIAMAVSVAPRPSFSQVSVGISVRIGPPPLPVYTQPFCPGPGYIWTPGYWAWGPYGYYWVPGTWVLPPEPGFLWTPGYWGWNGGLYTWYPGYWGPHVGFYGGINYGYGYTGVGYAGGYWNHGVFFYNRAVNRVNVTNVHVYNRTVIHNVTVNRVAYNGGPGGIAARPTVTEMRYARERHIAMTQAQMRQESIARSMPALRSSVNHGRPAIGATARPGMFRGAGVERSTRAGGQYRSFGPTQGQQNSSQPGRQQNNRRFNQRNEQSFPRGAQNRNYNRPRPANEGNHSPRARGANNRPGPKQPRQNRGNQQRNQSNNRDHGHEQ